MRPLPVVDPDGQLTAMVSIGDLSAWELDSQAIEIAHPQEHIHGPV